MILQELAKQIQKLIDDGHGELDVLVYERGHGYPLKINGIEIDFVSEDDVMNFDDFSKYNEDDKNEFTKCVLHFDFRN